MGRVVALVAKPSGQPWRDLPPHRGRWHRVYVRFARWRDAGVWERAAAWLLRPKRRLPHVRQRPVPLGSTSVRVHHQGTGANKAGAQAIGRSREGNTTKPHLAADGAGNVLGWRLTLGPAGDDPEAADLMAPWLVPARGVVADAACDSDALRAQIAAAVAVAVIKLNPRRKRMPHFTPVAYAQRHHIEQTINKLKHFRRVATRYDKLDSSYNAFVALRVTSLYLN